MPRKRLLVLAMFACLTLVGAACGSDGDDAGGRASPQARQADCGTGSTEPAAQNGTVRIGWIGDLTGANAAVVAASEPAARLAIDQANARGDLPVKIELVTIDNKDGNPDPVPGLVQRFISNSSLVGVIGPGFSGETKVAGPLFCEAGLTHITQSATNTDLTKNGWTTFFRALAPDAVQGGQTGDYIVKGLEKTKVAIVSDKSEYGAGLAEAVAQDVEDNGGEVVLNEGIEPTTDYTSVIDSVLATDHEVLFYGGYDAQAPLVAKQYREKGGEGTFVSGDGSKGTNLIEEGGEAVEGAVLTCPCLDPGASDDPAAAKFVTDFRAKYGEEPGQYSAEGFDVANIFIAAIKAGGENVSRASVLEYVTDLNDFKGLTKTFNWTDTHEVVAGEITYIYEVRDGRYALLGKASDLAEG